MGTKENERNGTQAYLYELMVKQSIQYFPIGRALSLPQIDSGEKDFDKVKREVEQLSTKIAAIESSLSGNTTQTIEAINQLKLLLERSTDGINKTK